MINTNTSRHRPKYFLSQIKIITRRFNKLIIATWTHPNTGRGGASGFSSPPPDLALCSRVVSHIPLHEEWCVTPLNSAHLGACQDLRPRSRAETRGGVGYSPPLKSCPWNYLAEGVLTKEPSLQSPSPTFFPLKCPQAPGFRDPQKGRGRGCQGGKQCLSGLGEQCIKSEPNSGPSVAWKTQQLKLPQHLASHLGVCFCFKNNHIRNVKGPAGGEVT